MRLMRRLVAACALVIAALFLTAPAAFADTTCKDFSSRQDAQVYLDKHSSQPGQLDGDRDGVACENSSGETVLALVLLGVVVTGLAAGYFLVWNQWNEIG